MLIDEIKKREINIFEAFALGRLVYGKSASMIFNIVFILGVPITLLIYYLSSAVNGVVANFDIMSIIQDSRMLEQFMTTQAGKQFYIYILLNILSYIVFLPLISLSVSKITNSFLYEEPITISGVISSVLSKSHIIIPAALLNSILVFSWVVFASATGLMVLVILCLITYVYLIFYECAIILDNKGIVESLKYSAYLVKGRILVTMLLAMLLLAVSNSASYLIAIVFSLFGESIVGNVCMNIVSMFVSAYFTVVLTVYYISRQGQKERDENSMQAS